VEIAGAQQDMSRAYAGGGPGVLVSGLVWLAASLIWARLGLGAGFVALFIGGVGIFPLSTAMARMLGCPPPDRANPLGRLALETTVPLLTGIVIAYVLLVRQPAMAIPVFAVIMGSRYFTFRTLYGQNLFWVLGGAIVAVGTLELLGRALPLGNLALQVAALELIIGAILFRQWHKGRG
jgi:hypothetical protein